MGAGTLLAACSAGTPPGGAGVPGAMTKQPVSLRLTQRAAGDEQFVHQYAAQFSQTYPNVKIELEEFPQAEYFTKVVTLASSNQLGDLLWSWNLRGQLSSDAHKGFMRPADDLARADKFDLKQFYAGSIEACRWDGKLWALPTVTHPGEVSLLYNLNLLDAAGVKAPDDKTSLNDVIEAGRRLTRDTDGDVKPDQWGFTSGIWQLPTRMRAFGGDILSEDGRKAQVNAAGSMAATQWEYDMMWRHRVAPTPADGQGSPLGVFQQGTIALAAGTVAAVTTLKAQIGERFRWGGTIFPAGPARRGTGLHVNTLSVTPTSKWPRESWEFIKSLTTREVGVQKVLNRSGSPGARPDVWNDQRLWSFEPFYRVAATLMTEAKPFATAHNLKTPDVFNTLEQRAVEVWQNKVTPQAWSEDVNRTIQSILDQPR
jgi:multiple sugar transport system substrate-binding protein